MKISAIAVRGFEDSRFGRVRRGDKVELTAHQVGELAARGLIHHPDEQVDPGKVPAHGGTSSASPAGQVLPQTILKPSGNGGRRRKAKAKAAPLL